MILDAKQVLQLLPQRAPIVMVDGAKRVECESESEAQLTITPDNWFVADNVFLEAGVMEHQAQSVAVCLGLQNKDQHPRTRQMGFIAEVKNFHLSRLPKVGETLYTRVTLTAEVEGVLLMEAKTWCDGQPTTGDERELIAQSQLKIFLPS